MANASADFVDEFIEAVESCYGGILGCPDDFPHFVDTVAQYMGADRDKVELVAAELINDNTITLKP